MIRWEEVVCGFRTRICPQQNQTSISVYPNVQFGRFSSKQHWWYTVVLYQTMYVQGVNFRPFFGNESSVSWELWTGWSEWCTLHPYISTVIRSLLTLLSFKCQPHDSVQPRPYLHKKRPDYLFIRLQMVHFTCLSALSTRFLSQWPITRRFRSPQS